jgi:predicted N-acyltransferase
MTLEETLFPGLARWRRRRTASEFEFLIADRIEAINPAWWDALTRTQSVFFSRAYLAMLEDNAPENLTPRYALLSRRGHPVAALVMQKLELQAERFLPPADSVSDWKQRIKRSARALASQPLDERRILVLGNLLSYGQHAYVVDESIKPEAFWHGAAEALYRVRRAEKLEGGADIQMIKDLDGTHIESAQSLTDFGYREAETEPNMLLTLDPAWKSYADYLASLSSKYRKNTQSRILAPFNDAAYRIGVIANPGAIAARLHELYLAVHEAADLRPFTLPESYWRALPETLGADMRIVGIWQHELLVGFVAMLRDRDATVYAYHIGFDRCAAQAAPIYLRLLHAAIDEAIAMGGRSISLGRTALEPKAALGARPERMVVYARHRQPILNKLLRGLLAHVGHEQAPERHPFKQTAVP